MGRGRAGTPLGRVSRAAASRTASAAGSGTGPAAAASAPSCPTVGPAPLSAARARSAVPTMTEAAATAGGCPPTAAAAGRLAAGQSPARTAGQRAPTARRVLDSPGTAPGVTAWCPLEMARRARRPGPRVAARSRRRTAYQAPLSTHKTGTNHPYQPSCPSRVSPSRLMPRTGARHPNGATGVDWAEPAPVRKNSIATGGHR
jgi:hypothetical protein